MVSTESHILANATNDILSMLGERAAKALFLELRLLEISTKPEEFDIIKIDKGLKKIFGSAAELFMGEIYTEFKTRLSEEGISDVEIEINDANIPAAAKISRLLAVKATT
jgi:hypothetical protein